MLRHDLVPIVQHQGYDARNIVLPQRSNRHLHFYRSPTATPALECLLQVLPHGEFVTPEAKTFVGGTCRVVWMHAELDGLDPLDRSTYRV